MLHNMCIIHVYITDASKVFPTHHHSSINMLPDNTESARRCWLCARRQRACVSSFH